MDRVVQTTSTDSLYSSDSRPYAVENVTVNQNDSQFSLPYDYYYYYYPYHYFTNFVEYLGISQIYLVYFLFPVFLVLGTFGLITNVINLIVFIRQGPLSDSCTACFIGLAVFDFWVCAFGVFTTFMALLQRLGLLDGSVSYIYGAVAFGIQYIKLLFSQCTWMITVYLSIERFVSVTFPFKVKIIFSAKKSYIVIVLIFVLSFLLRIPMIFQMISHILRSRGDFSLHDIFQSPLASSIMRISTFVTDVILCPIGAVLVLIFNIIIVAKVARSNKLRSRRADRTSLGGAEESKPKSQGIKSSHSQKETKLTKMMIAISALFICCYSFVILQSMFSQLSEELRMRQYLYIYVVISDLTPCFEMLNSSVNILIYSSLSSKYKNELCHLMMKLRCW